MLKTRIPLKEPHVRQFVVVRYGMGSSTIDLSKKTTLGQLITLACQKIGYLHTLPKTDLKDSECITLEMPDSLKNHFIHPAKIQAITKLLGMLFDHAFLDCVESCIMLGLSDYYAVEFFMEKYGITEDMVSSDTLRKKWRNHQAYMKRKLAKMEMI